MNIKTSTLSLVWIITLMIIANPVYASNAPITAIATITACPGSAISVPVTVTNFSAIASITLRMDYNNTMMQFNPSTTSFNAVFGSNLPIIDCAYDPLSGFYAIRISWADMSPKTLPDGSTLVTLGFNYTDGPATLSFNDIDFPACEYAGGMPPIVLPDVPTSNYYHNGQVSSAALAGSVTGGSTIYYGAGTGTLVLSGYSGSVLKWQKQYNDEDYTDIANTAATYSETPAYTGTWNYRALVQNSPCAAVYSSPVTVTVLTPVGTSKTWTGATDNDWKKPTNWSPPGTPVALDNVIIPTDTPIPEVSNTVATCHNLFISNEASLTVIPSNNLVVSGTLTIEGP